MELKKLLTQKPLTDFLRCSGMPETKIKGHIGLEIVFGTICYHIGTHLVIVPSVHRQNKIGHLKRVGACTQVVLLACKIMPFVWYVYN